MKLLILLSIMFFGSKNSIKQSDIHALNNEEWTWVTGNKAAGSGTTWLFSKDNTFTATHWYSGGAYWRYKYEGTYYYDGATKTVYLKYKNNKALPPVKTNLCIQLADDLSGSYTPIFYDGWKKYKHKYVPVGNPKVKTAQIGDPNNTINTDFVESFTRKTVPVDKLKQK
ncbi:hypothetical protein [Pedobacter nototheniae]|uniref:hypothetical protein n=1 Tax=Pedobacter nototheniae TaxID=2488994 RepID=UPI00292DC7E9|nr:hypothetical protein [Pedobacter nototheniae]